MASTIGNASPVFSSYSDASAVTTSDTTVLIGVKGLWIGGTGNVSVVTFNGNTVTFTAVPSGVLLPIAVTKVRATGTTATNILALS